MPKEIEQSCSNCMYEDGGKCRRYPPVMQMVHITRDGDESPRTDTFTQWPEVNTYSGSTEWCGEWAQPTLVPDRNP